MPWWPRSSRPAARRKAVLLVSSYLPGTAWLVRSHRGDAARTAGEARPADEWNEHSTDAGGHRVRERGVMTRVLRGAGGPVLGLFFVALVFGILIGARFFLPGNLELLARQTAIVAAAALGMTLVIVSGGIDLSVGSVVALTTVVIACCSRRDGRRWPPPLPASRRRRCAGSSTASSITRLRVVPFIVTLGTMILVRGRGQGPGGRAPHRGAADLAQRPAARHGAGEARPAAGRRVDGGAAGAVVVAAVLRYTPFRPPRLRDRLQRADRAAVRRAVNREPRS